MGDWDVVSTAPASAAAPPAAVNPWAVVKREPSGAKDIWGALGQFSDQARDAVTSFGGGIPQGMTDVARSTIDPVMSWAEKKLPGLTAVAQPALQSIGLGGGNPLLLGLSQLAKPGAPAQRTTQTQQWNQANAGNIPAQAGRVTGQVAATAPLMAVGGAALAPLKAAPIIGPAAQFLAGEGGLASQVANSALQGSAGALLTHKASDAPLWQQMAVGGALGGALPLAGAATNWVGDKTGDLLSALSPKRFTQPLTQGGQQQVAGKLLLDAAGSVPAMGAPPLPGMSLSPGQQSGNQGLLWLERGQEQANPAINSAFAAQKVTNNAALRSAIGQVGDLSADAPAAIEARLVAAQQASKAATQALWKAANVDEQTSVPTNWLRARTDDYLNGLKVAERKVIGSDLTSTLDELPDHTNLGEIQAWRADIGDKVRAAARAGEANKARILGGLQGVVSDFTDELPMMGGNKPTQEAMDAYQAARDATRQMKQTFTEPPTVRNALGVDRFGADKVPTSAMADQFIRTGKGAPEALGAYLKAVGTDPEGLQAARDAFAQKFMDAAETTATNTAGDRQLSTAAIRRFTDNYGHVIDSPLFNPTQRTFIRSIADAADMASRRANAAPPGGSDTAAKLAAGLYGDKTYLQALLGKRTVGLIDAGATAAGLTHGPLGAVGAHIGIKPLLGAIYSAPRENVTELLTKAMTDPDLARTLMMKATPASEAMIKPAVSQKLLSILGSVPTYGYTIPAQRALNPAPPQAQ